MELKEVERKIKYYNQLKKDNWDNEGKKSYYNKCLKKLRELRSELKGVKVNER